jgi:hypothetical protein
MMALQIADDTQEHAWHATQPASEVDIPPMLAAALVPNPASKPSAWPILDKPFGDPQKLSKTEKKGQKEKTLFRNFFSKKSFLRHLSFLDFLKFCHQLLILIRTVSKVHRLGA